MFYLFSYPMLIYNGNISLQTEDLTMELENSITTRVPVVPEELKNKITFAANYALTDFDVVLFTGVLIVINAQLKEDGMNYDDLTRVNVLFTRNGSFSMHEESETVLGLHFSLAVYPMEILHRVKDPNLVCFCFIEELVHHYWRIENETDVKYKTLEIIQRIDKKITVETLKGWGVNGL